MKIKNNIIYFTAILSLASNGVFASSWNWNPFSILTRQHAKFAFFLLPENPQEAVDPQDKSGTLIRQRDLLSSPRVHASSNGFSKMGDFSLPNEQQVVPSSHSVGGGDKEPSQQATDFTSRCKGFFSSVFEQTHTLR